MSDINAIRLPILVFVPPPYVSDDVNLILTRGERWAQYPSNNVPIVLKCYVLAFAEYSLVH